MGLARRVRTSYRSGSEETHYWDLSGRQVFGDTEAMFLALVMLDVYLLED